MHIECLKKIINIRHLTGEFEVSINRCISNLNIWISRHIYLKPSGQKASWIMGSFECICSINSGNLNCIV